MEPEAHALRLALNYNGIAQWIQNWSVLPKIPLAGDFRSRVPQEVLRPTRKELESLAR